MESTTDKSKKAVAAGYFPFLVRYRDVIDELEEKDQLGLYKAITDYGLYMVEPHDASAVVRAVFKVLKPLLDRSHTNRMNGKHGGGQKGNQNARKTSEKRAKTSENEQSGFSRDITIETIETIETTETTETIETTETTENIEKEKGSDSVDVVVEYPKQKVLDSIKDVVWLDKFAYQYNVDCQTARNLAERVIADWELANIADDQWTQSHLLNAMRKKLESDNKSIAEKAGKMTQREQWEQSINDGAIQDIVSVFGNGSGNNEPY